MKEWNNWALLISVFNTSLFPDYEIYNEHEVRASLSYQDHPLGIIEYNPIILESGEKTTLNVQIEEVLGFLIFEKWFQTMLEQTC